VVPVRCWLLVAAACCPGAVDQPGVSCWLQRLAALGQLTSLRPHNLGWSSDVLREHILLYTLPSPFMHESCHM